MGTLLIILFLIVLIVISFNYFLKNNCADNKKSLNDKRGKVSEDVQAESETDKLIRHLDERQNAEYNAELATHRDSAPSPKSPKPTSPDRIPQNRDAS
ncbi:hypothetical protein [Nitrosomonas supralitoralis]|uniref:Uncharacterized protein n=1 Tax=Nitrosomonas supralitoralis TaxID=2116706 RepID=A0A2P7NRQ3_9PROT|nr:hypothetical protein [Nitrosomonas supralitoralis]PSJ16117.1 hypothetical protein C7H79_15280 [Nitrosomonas supralitoralis]